MSKDIPNPNSIPFSENSGVCAYKVFEDAIMEAKKNASENRASFKVYRFESFWCVAPDTLGDLTERGFNYNENDSIRNHGGHKKVIIKKAVNLKRGDILRVGKHTEKVLYVSLGKGSSDLLFVATDTANGPEDEYEFGMGQSVEVEI